MDSTERQPNVRMNSSRFASRISRLTLPTWVDAVIIAIAFVIGAALTWRKWPDVLVDFGMQLYLPWKISQGSVLYHDIAYLPGGPFSQNFNAVIFKVFGASLLTLAITNMAIVVGLVVLMYRKFRAASDRLTATLIGLSVVLVFAFGEYSDVDNYNYITPYSHEVWHGLVLSVVAMMLLSNWVMRQRIAYAAAAGFCGGLVFMTKPDVFVAMAVGGAAAFVLFAITRRNTGFLLKSFSLFLAASALPLVAFLFYFHKSDGWRESLRSVCFAWTPLFESRVSATPYYKWCAGLDAPWLNARLMLIHFAVICLCIAISAVVFRRNMKKAVNRMLAACWIAVLAGLASGFDWAADCARAFPLLMAVLLVFQCVKHRQSAEAPNVFPFLWTVFGFVLLAKLGLHCRIWHYGFALAMPAFMAMVYALVWLLPNWLEKRGVNRAWFRSATVSVLLTGIGWMFLQTNLALRHKNVAIGNGADLVFAPADKSYPVGEDLRSALNWLDQNTAANSTLAVLPEGAIINYLARRTNPSHYLVWIPIEMMVFGQENMTRDFESHPPDYIMLVHRSTAEYGLKYFGQEDRYGGEIMRWINQNYETATLIGNEPLVNARFGIKILRRKTGKVTKL